MKFLFAPDSFKGSLSAREICDLLEQAAARHFPQARTHSVPVADGGEGTVDALVGATGGRLESVRVTGPLGEKVEAAYGVLGDGRTVVLEMAQASGLPLVPGDRRSPFETTSYGTGELIAHVLGQGFRSLLIGIGGSATNDGGMGMLSALGAVFVDAQGERLWGRGADLERVEKADFSGLLPALREASITVICDVDNPLLGERGATMIYGPQKGAKGEVLTRLERGMAHYARVVEASLGRGIADTPGAGAAGGMGAALGGVLGANLESGISAVLTAVRFDEMLEDTDLVITGEGRLDAQSIAYGKVPAGVAKRCAQRGIPVVAIVGGMAAGAEGLFDLAESSIVTTINAAMPIDEAIHQARPLFESAADRMFRMLKIGSRLGEGK